MEGRTQNMDDVWQEICQKIFHLFEQYECSVGAAEIIMNDVKKMIGETVPVKSGFYASVEE